MDKNEKSRVKDIAKLVGVSSGTVSNALNNRKGVSDVKRREILQVARSIGYGRAPMRRTDNALRFVIIKRHGAVVDDTPFFSQLIKGIETESKNNGYDLLISHLNLKDLSSSIIQEMSESSNGMIVLATEMRAKDLALFEPAGNPIVLLDSYFYASPYDCVLINNEEGVRIATEHLIQKGHRIIGLLDASSYINNFYYRRKSFFTTMAEYGLPVDPAHEIPLTPTMEGAYKDMKKRMQENFSLPEAYFAENDIIALGVIRALNEEGIRIPEDVSIIGFDDMPYCELSTPRLTTIRVQKMAMGSIAVKTIVDFINGTRNETLKTEVCTSLVERESVRQIENPSPLKPNNLSGVL